jgi:hypothetical protein
MEEAAVSTAVWSLAGMATAGGGDHAEKVCQATLKRAGEDEELGISSTERREVFKATN